MMVAMDSNYWAVHKWMQRNHVKTGTCETCGETKRRTQWANISGVYRRNRADFRELCRPCHNRLDGLAQNLGTRIVKSAHLGEPVGHALANLRKTHCKHGHEFTPENTYEPPKRPGRRYCKACRERNTARWRGESVR